MSARETDLTLIALEYFATYCETQGHAACGGEAACYDELEMRAKREDSERAAEWYDVGQVLADHLGEIPDHFWPTAALLRTVVDLMLTPPWLDARRRSHDITVALARLGERGVPVDAIVRTCIGPELCRRALFEAASAWHALKKNQSFDEDALPERLREWVQLVDETVDGDGVERKHLEFPDVVVSAMNLASGDRCVSWVREATITHLVGWSIKNFVRTDLALDEITLPAGREATMWIYDRFTKTSLDDWSRASLCWELVWLSGAQGICDQVGLATEIINERPSSTPAIMHALSRRLMGVAGSDAILGDMGAGEVQMQVVLLLRSGKITQAQSLCRRAKERAPYDALISNALAFCTVPIDPVEARRQLDNLAPGTASPATLCSINEMTTYMVEKNWVEAIRIAGEIFESCGESSAWLWEPESLETDSPSIIATSQRDWLRRSIQWSALQLKAAQA